MELNYRRHGEGTEQHQVGSENIHRIVLTCTIPSPNQEEVLVLVVHTQVKILVSCDLSSFVLSILQLTKKCFWTNFWSQCKCYTKWTKNFNELFSSPKRPKSRQPRRHSSERLRCKGKSRQFPRKRWRPMKNGPNVLLCKKML